MWAVTELQLLLDEMSAYDDALWERVLQDQMIDDQRRQASSRRSSETIIIGDDVAESVESLRRG